MASFHIIILWNENCQNWLNPWVFCLSFEFFRPWVFLARSKKKAWFSDFKFQPLCSEIATVKVVIPSGPAPFPANNHYRFPWRNFRHDENFSSWRKIFVMTKIWSWIFVMAKIFVLDFRHDIKSCRVFVITKIHDKNFVITKTDDENFCHDKTILSSQKLMTKFFCPGENCAHVWKITWTL